LTKTDDGLAPNFPQDEDNTEMPLLDDDDDWVSRIVIFPLLHIGQISYNCDQQ